MTDPLPRATRDDEGLTYWTKVAPIYDASLRLLAGPFPRMLELVREHVRHRAHVLEVASGTGLVTEAIAPLVGALVATDFSPAMVERTRQRAAGLANVTCQQADIYALSFAEGSFDAVVAANVLHLVPDLEGALAALSAVLSPGGLLIAPTYCHAETRVSLALSRLASLQGFPSRRRFKTGMLASSMIGAGLRVVSLERIGGLVPVGFVAAKKRGG